MHLFFILFSFLAFQLQALEDNQQIVVKLATEKKLMPLYLSKIYEDNPGVDKEYMQKLRAIMFFDLNYNGMTQVMAANSELEKVLDSVDFDHFGDLTKWKNHQVSYVIKIRVQNKELDVRVLSTSGGMIRGVDDLPLTGDFGQDRKQVHRLADAIHRILFGKEGIASSHVLFTRRIQEPGQKKWASEVWEMDYDGGNVRQVTKEAGYSVTPMYAPTQVGQPTQFYYVSYKTGQPKIYLASLKEGIGRRFTLLKGNQLLPAISRLNDKVAFISDYTGNPDVFLQPLNPKTHELGKPFQVFAHFRATQGSPTFNPDGTKIAFVSDKDGSPKIYLLDLPAPGAHIKKLAPTLLTKYQRESTAPCWSPDGSKIAYCAMTKDVRQIWIYDFEKKEEIQLTSGPDHKENPSWAPDNLHLVFNSVTPKGSEIYIVNLNQPKPVKISSGIGEKRFPNWEPRLLR